MVGHDLPGEVDLDRRVDGGHPAERADDVGVVREVDLAHLDHRVVVDEVIQPLAAHQERRDDLAAVALLERARDDAGLDEVDDRVAEHLGVDAEIALAVQGEGGGGRDRADPELDRRAVGDQIGDILADPSLHLAGSPLLYAYGGCRIDGEIDLRHVVPPRASGHRR
jgi:hypothetical protein